MKRASSTDRGNLPHRLSERYTVDVLVSGIHRSVECLLEVLNPEGPTLVAVCMCASFFFAYMPSPFAPWSNMKAEGLPNMKGTAGGGMTLTVPYSNGSALWCKCMDPGLCSSNVPFSVALPTILVTGMVHLNSLLRHPSRKRWNMRSRSGVTEGEGAGDCKAFTGGHKDE